MFNVSVAWWELVLRGTVVYLVLLAIIRLSGKRTVGQFTPFDLLVIMLLGEAVSDSLTGGDESLPGGLVVAATLLLLNMFFGYITARYRKAADVIEGSAELIGRDGEIFLKRLEKSRVGIAEFEQALRAADCALEDMKYAFLEADGSISIMKK